MTVTIGCAGNRDDLARSWRKASIEMIKPPPGSVLTDESKAGGLPTCGMYRGREVCTYRK